MNEGDVTVTVTDGTDAISGATVTIANADDLSDSETTDSDGEAVFQDIDNGTYTITASKSNYTTETKTITVNGDTEVEIELTPTRSVSFTVNDGTDPIQSATVTIDGDETGAKTTGSSGGCTATLSDGEHEVVVAKDGYTTKTETIIVDGEHTSFTISLTAS